MKFVDYYETLGVPRTATADEIRRAYRRLALEWHPDRHPPSERAAAEERFKRISEAHEVLSDPEKRRRYDALGEHWKNGQEFRPPPGFGQGGFERMFGGAGGFSDFFAQMFGDFFAEGPRRSGRPRTRGADVEAELELGAGLALLGGKRAFELNLSVPCQKCDGEGRIGRHACPACGGLGRSQATRRIDLSIPDDAYDGQVLRLRGLGERGAGEAGDLLLKLRIVGDDVYRPRGDHLEADVPIAPWEALDGTSVDVRVPSGVAKARIPPGTRAGDRLRLRGQGLARRGGGRGDLLLVVRLALPDDLTERQRRLLRELRGGTVRGGARIG
ncbi:MAG: DnaJ C-terminal domain-containing protein [Planctomycetota bacterium]